jgi:hypothetical protein
MTGETFSGDTINLKEVLENEYLLIHELVEINELKKSGIRINRRVIVDLPKTIVYDAHLTAIETELDYALYKKDYLWIKVRLRQYKESVLDNDPNLPSGIKPRAEKMFKKFSEILKKM